MKLSLSVKRRLYIFLALLIVVKADLLAQDPHFSQFFANPVYTNPAFAGSSNHGRAVINARNQWSSTSGTFKTISASYDENFAAINGGIGIIVSRDEAGIGLLTTNTISLAYSYQINVNKYLTFRASVQAAIVQKRLDFDNFTWGDQILRNAGIIQKTGQPIPSEALNLSNFGAGFLGYTKYVYGGFAVHNLTEPSQSFYGSNAPIHRRITAHAGAQIPIVETRSMKNSMSISPNVIYMQQRLVGGNYNEINLGMYYNKGSYVIGGYFRQVAGGRLSNADALVLLLGLRREKLRIGYTYDATISNARPGSPSSHEISLAFEFRKKKPKKPIRAIRCPEF